MLTLKKVGWIIRIMVVTLPVIALSLHTFRKISGSTLIKKYIAIVLLMELLGMAVPQGYIYLLGIAPLVHTIFYIEAQKDFLNRGKKTLLQIRVTAIIIAMGLFPSLSIDNFKAYSSLFFNAIILFLNLSFLYTSIDSKKHLTQQQLYFNYASLLFFGIQLFLAISSNFPVNATPHLVFALRIALLLLLLWYCCIVIRFAHV